MNNVKKNLNDLSGLKNFYTPALYEKIKDNGYNFAKIIIPELKKIKQNNLFNVLDVGCGGGSFLKGCEIQNLDIIGVDAPHVKGSLQILNSKIQYENLEKPLFVKKNGTSLYFDLCVSLEVAEHIDQKYSDIFIDSLCRHSDLILFSAAQPGQPGINHINCQNLDFWIKKFEKRGYKHIESITIWIRKNQNIYNWYRKNSMIFKKEK